jgi:hypothetical protein
MSATIDAPSVAQVPRETIHWLWRKWFPRGKVVVVDGDPNVGKSTFTHDLAARVSTGAPFPDDDGQRLASDVVLLSAEDGIGDTIRPRLEAAGANLERVHVLKAVDGRLPELPRDVGKLRSLIDEVEASLVIVDPLMAFLSGTIDAHRDQDVRRALHLMAELAEDTRVALVVVRHLNKGFAGNPLYRGGGSIGIIGAARAGMVIAPDPSDDSRRVLAMTKCNLAPMPQALAFRLVSDEQYKVARVKWEGTTSHSASDLLSAPTDEEEKGALGEAVEFLRDALEDGQRASKDVQREAREAGVSERTLRRAQKRLKIRPRKVGVPGSDSQRWVWELPEAEDGQETPKMAKAAKENGWAPSEVANKKVWPSWQPSDEVGNLREPDFTFDNDIEPCIVCGDPTPVHDPQGRSRHPVCEVTSGVAS